MWIRSERGEARAGASAGRWLGALAVLVVLGLGTDQASGAVEPAPEGWKAKPFRACRDEPCPFEDPTGANRYELAEGVLSRSADGERLYRRSITGKFETVLLSGISGTGNQLVVIVARERISSRGRSGFATRSSSPDPTQRGRGRSPDAPVAPGVHPGDVEREHRVEVLNPKTGETIKFIDLGAFRPRELALTPYGKRVLLAGTDLQLRRDEVRIYDTRSGKLEHREEVRRAGKATLAADGYRVGDQAWVVTESEPSGGVRRFNSRDPYSIAEYVVQCSGDAEHYRGRTVAVTPFKGVEPAELAQMLTNGLALKLAGAGFELVERERMDDLLDELWLQSTGVTGEEQAAGLGRMSNARYLALAELREAGTTTSLTVRLVSVEKATVVDGCEVSCRDCRPDDYLEALEYLVRVWGNAGGGELQ